MLVQPGEKRVGGSLKMYLFWRERFVLFFERKPSSPCQIRCIWETEKGGERKRERGILSLRNTNTKGIL